MNSFFNPKRLFRLSAGLAFLLVLASGCGAPAAVPAPTLAPSPVLVTLSPTLTETTAPTLTLAPASTMTVTPSQTASPSPAPSATAQAALDQAKVLTIGNQVGGVLVTLQVPNLTTAYNLILGGIKFTCQLDDKNKGQLNCWGLAAPAKGTTLNITFLNPADGSIVFKGKTFIAGGDTAPGTKIYTGNNCANAGQNQSCEMECRVDPNTNQPCIVASCFDACGGTYSIQTCSNAVNLKDFAMCDGPTMAAMKKLYNIP